MEKFKAVEKAMKTKAYSKEGLSAAAKLDPKEQAKVEAGEFLSSMVDELEQQIETLEAESEQISATSKKGKVSGAKAERINRIDEIIEKHKWHQGKLELIRRSLENGGVDTDQVTELEENIRYYVSDGMNDDFMDDDEMYDELDLEDEEGNYGLGQENEKGSSQDNQSVQEEMHEPEPPKPVKKVQKEVVEPAATKKPTTQTKSPLPALATLHTPLSAISNGSTSNGNMKPASVPTRPVGEGLKYASAAAAAAAASDNVGISPLPPPPGITPPLVQTKRSAANSPAVTHAQPATSTPQPAEPKQPAASLPPTNSENDFPAPVPKSTKRAKAASKQPAAQTPASESTSDNAKGLLPFSFRIFHFALLTRSQPLKQMATRTESSLSRKSQKKSLSTICRLPSKTWSSHTTRRRSTKRSHFLKQRNDTWPAASLMYPMLSTQRHRGCTGRICQCHQRPRTFPASHCRSLTTRGCIVASTRTRSSMSSTTSRARPSSL